MPRYKTTAARRRRRHRAEDNRAMRKLEHEAKMAKWTPEAIAKLRAAHAQLKEIEA